MELKNTSLTLPIVKKNCEHVFHLYSLYHPKRGVIIKQLKEKKIEVKIYYPAPIHLMKAYKDFNKTKNSNWLVFPHVFLGYKMRNCGFCFFLDFLSKILQAKQTFE